MAEIDRMQRGSLSEQFFKRMKDGREVIHGPYYVLQHRDKGKHCSQRVPVKNLAPVRSAIEGRERFEKLAQGGMGTAQQVVFIGDGAGWVWAIARINFPGAVHILDFYHAAEHLKELCDALYGKESEKSKVQRKKWRTRFKEDGIDQVIA